MYRRRLLSLASTILVCATLLSPALAAETIPFSKQDHQVDTAIALQMQEADGSTKRYFFTLSGELGQMVMCKATFKSHLSRIMQALRADKEFKHRKVLGAECARTKTKPIAIYP
jgi:hypothetical protein